MWYISRKNNQLLQHKIGTKIRVKKTRMNQVGLSVTHLSVVDVTKLAALCEGQFEGFHYALVRLCGFCCCGDVIWCQIHLWNGKRWENVCEPKSIICEGQGHVIPGENNMCTSSKLWDSSRVFYTGRKWHFEVTSGCTLSDALVSALLNLVNHQSGFGNDS